MCVPSVCICKCGSTNHWITTPLSLYLAIPFQHFSSDYLFHCNDQINLAILSLFFLLLLFYLISDDFSFSVVLFLNITIYIYCVVCVSSLFVPHFFNHYHILPWRELLKVTSSNLPTQIMLCLQRGEGHLITWTNTHPYKQLTHIFQYGLSIFIASNLSSCSRHNHIIYPLHLTIEHAN